MVNFILAKNFINVDFCFEHIPYADTHSFSSLVQDYLAQADSLRPFYKYQPNKIGIATAINERKQYKVNRTLLVDVLNEQYQSLEKSTLVEENITALLDEQTFTICTAHQPNLLTGYLYFVYKIIHAIKLAEELSLQYPDNKFVPIYYMGSEDNDLDELGTFRYDGKRYKWDAAGQEGAVGRMNTQSLKPLLEELFKVMGPPGKYRDDLEKLLRNAYVKHNNIADATQYLVNELFGRFGLVVINPDSTVLKSSFIEVMKNDLLYHTAHPIVEHQASDLAKCYKSQAYPRSINLFYLKDNIRERIEEQDGFWYVLNTTIKWTKSELLHELKQYPECFSPNVILRGLFQETILPNVVFIGGGAEVAYWLQLLPLFAHYRVFYPVVLLRQSVQWISAAQQKKINKLELSLQDVFLPLDDLIKTYVARNTTNDWQTQTEEKAIAQILNNLQQKAKTIDATLEASADAALAKIKHQLLGLERKMLRAEKRKAAEKIKQLTQLKANLFPNNVLQERVNNFTEYYLQLGNLFFDIIKDNLQPTDGQFMIVSAVDKE